MVSERTGGEMLLGTTIRIEYGEIPGPRDSGMTFDVPVHIELWEPNEERTRHPRNAYLAPGTNLRGLRSKREATEQIPPEVLAHTIEYEYDDKARRRLKKMDGVPVESYQWLDPLRLAAIGDGQGRTITRFHYVQNARIPYAATCQGSLLYLFYDHVGSLRVASDNTGNIVRLVDYDAFGYITRDTNPDLYLGYGFAGGLQDADTGSVRFGVRDYDPDLGRFITPDPAGRDGQANHRAEQQARAKAEAGKQVVDPDCYGYSLDDPVNIVDPTGMSAIAAFYPAMEQAGMAASDFVDNYTDMVEANTVGADKYFHCKANCEATKRGPVGKATAWGLSELREVYGQWKGDPASDKAADQQANSYGRTASPDADCGDHCTPYRPDALEDKW